MRTYLVFASAISIIARSVPADAAQCSPISSNYWTVYADTMQMAPGTVAWILEIQLYKKSDGGIGCSETIARQKGGGTVPVSLTQSTCTAAAQGKIVTRNTTVADCAGSWYYDANGTYKCTAIAMVPSYTPQIIRIPLSYIKNGQKFKTEYDAVMDPNKHTFCYATVDANGTSEYWNGQ